MTSFLVPVDSVLFRVVFSIREAQEDPSSEPCHTPPLKAEITVRKGVFFSIAESGGLGEHFIG